MGTTYNKFYKVFNGTDWDIYYIATQAGIVHETSNRMFVHVSGDRFKGTWSNSTNYTTGDIVEYNGVYYIAVAGGTNHDPEAGTWAYWEEFDLSRAASGDNSDHNNGFMSAAQAYKLAGLNVVDVLNPKSGYVDVNGVAKQVIPDHTVTTNGDPHTSGKVPVWDSSSDVLAPGLSVSATGGTGYNGVLVQTNSNGKIDTTFIPDSILNSLKYKGTWDASSSTSSYPSGTTPATGDYWIASVSGSHNPDGGLSAKTYDIGDWAICRGTITDYLTNEYGSSYKGVYNPSTTYQEGSIVTYRVNSSAVWKAYSSIEGVHGEDPTNPAYWAEVETYGSTDYIWDEIDNQTKVVSVNNRTGVVSVYQGNVASGTTYNKGDIVWRTTDSSLYICIADGSAGSAITDTNKFRRMSSPLYSSTGQATDGAMTQKATTDAINNAQSKAIESNPFRTYTVDNSDPYFVRIAGPYNYDTIDLEEDTSSDISAYSANGWATLAKYFLYVLNITDSATSPTNSANAPVSALFISTTKGADVQTTMTSNLLGWFNFTSSKMKISGTANQNIVIKSFEVEVLYNEVKITANIKNGREYEIHIVDTSSSHNWSTIATNGWRVVKDIFDESSVNNISNALVGDICLETIS